LPKEDVTKLIEETYKDRPKMLRGFGEIFFFQNITAPFSEWFFKLGLEAASWSTIKAAITLRDEPLFSDLSKIHVPTLILHGIHDKVSLFPLAIALNKNIKNSRLVPFENSGHGLFWEEKEKLNKELAQFMEG
jgi:non-heme chloroperoxidase